MPIRVVAFLAGTLPTLSVSLSPQYNSTRSTLNLLCPPSGTATSYPLSSSTSSEYTLNAFMATPSSSATSPSPPMAYLAPGPGSQQSDSASSDTLEREQRQKAVKKFLARAEISMVTRALRARLSYASYKATRNIPHVSLRELESQGQSQTASFNRTIAAKRKAVAASTSTYNPPPVTQASNTPAPGSARRGGSGSMAPPAAVSSPRTHHPSAAHPHSYTASDLPASLRKPGQAPNLFSAILAPPPTRQARTIHNPNDPPVPAPTRPTPSPRIRPSRTSPRNDPARPQSKQKQVKNAKTPVSPNRRRGKTASVDKGKQKQIATGSMDVDGDVDMKAAATLTSLLMHHQQRPSISGSASSPRSSIDSSEPSSVFSYSHFAQSSARTAAPSSLGPTATLIERTQTPPPPAGGTPRQQTTPRAAPTDNEAANLMLFLATSPSPARASKDSKDLAAYRALGGGTGPLRTKGRVLFPSSSAPDHPHAHEDVSAGTHKLAPALARGGESSFTSSISSIGAELGGTPRTQTKDGYTSSSGVNTTSSTAMDVDAPSRLLPSAPLPFTSAAPASPVTSKDAMASPRLKSTTTTTISSAGGNTTGTPDFNIREFINASPSSPSRAQATHGHRSNLGLRADVGRKLFEGEQLRHAQALQAAAASSVASSGTRQDERGLSAGVDLVQT
ncbi:hypothetical protein CVT24_008093 [Panaeolus cyanescens]|uniref:Uncharacterized protein n=1 Tax=Panaeolus cyanescens TaxID=181874 RepID=A0A409YLF9_9AGAR|nr:hypothetical protein CVT24_008093 [Panaeolus cyanescens]